MINEVNVRCVAHPSDQILKEVEEIYVANIPENERTPFDELKAMLDQKTRELFVAEVKDHVVAFGFVAHLKNAIKDVNLYYLAYMAVEAGNHGKGIGSRYFQGMCKILKSRADAEGLVFEMESDAVGSKEEKVVRKRRVEFYQRNGGLLLDVPSYKVPLFEAGGNFTAIPALLTWCPFDKVQPPPTRKKILQIIEAIYKTEFSDYMELCSDIISEYEHI